MRITWFGRAFSVFGLITSEATAAELRPVSSAPHRSPTSEDMRRKFPLKETLVGQVLHT